MPVPQNVIDGINCLLAPYGVNLQQMIDDSAQGYMTAKQASNYCGLSSKTIRDKVLAGDISSFKLGNNTRSRVLIKKSDLDNWLKRFSQS